MHLADWKEFQARFGASPSRRVWLSSRLRALLDLAATTGKLRRVFTWGSFVTVKAAPKDLNTLRIVDEDFAVDRIAAQAQAVFDSARAKLLFESDVFWASVHRTRIARSLAGDLSDFQKFSKPGIVEL